MVADEIKKLMEKKPGRLSPPGFCFLPVLGSAPRPEGSTLGV